MKPLGSFIKNISDGGTPSTSDQSNFGGGIPWIVISDIQLYSVGVLRKLNVLMDLMGIQR